MYDFFLGIDPGLEGAFVVLDKAGQIIRVEKIPVLQIDTKKKIDLHVLSSLVKEINLLCPSIIATVEKINAAPGQGVTSMFTMGYGAGAIDTALSCHLMAYQHVHPRTWKAAIMRDMPKEKDASVVKALQLFPKVSSLLITPRGKRDHNIADALLIAEWARRQFITG